MKTVLSCCTAKVFAQALLPMAAMSPPPQAAAENDNKSGSVPRNAWPRASSVLLPLGRRTGSLRGPTTAENGLRPFCC